jgi:hypothetical protein
MKKYTQFKNEIKIIERLISILKKKTKLDFIKEKIKIGNTKEFNVWYSPFKNKIKVSVGVLRKIKEGFLKEEDIKIILYHEFGHAANPLKIVFLPSPPFPYIFPTRIEL